MTNEQRGWPDTPYELAVQTALGEDAARLLVQCVCASCQKVVATIHLTSHGMLFRGTSPAGDVFKQLPDAPRDPVILYLSEALLDWPGGIEGDQPRTTCSKHGKRAIDVPRLIAAASEAALTKSKRLYLN